MYYETIMHERRTVENAAQAAELIHTGNVHDYDALCWKAPDGRTLAVVADNHCNNPWKEVAVIDLDNDQQIESLTFGWVPELEKKIEHLHKCETGDFRMGEPGTAVLPIDGKNTDAQAWFECGCCGESFQSTISKQRRFDQDNGYGMCPRCAY